MRYLIFILAFASAWGQVEDYGRTANAAAIYDLTAAAITRAIKSGASDPATCTLGKDLFVNTASTPVLKLCTATNTWSTLGGGGSTTVNGQTCTIGSSCTVTASLPSNPAACTAGQYVSDVAADGTLTCGTPAVKRTIALAVGDPAGTALSTGVLGYLVVPSACTISAWDIVVDAGTATVDVWKVGTGTAKPTVSNTITASAKPAISTGTVIHSTTLTGWTTSVSANDIIGFNLDTVATAKYIYVGVVCE